MKNLLSSVSTINDVVDLICDIDSFNSGHDVTLYHIFYKSTVPDPVPVPRVKRCVCPYNGIVGKWSYGKDAERNGFGVVEEEVNGDDVFGRGGFLGRGKKREEKTENEE
jgi:hypothetical protein